MSAAASGDELRVVAQLKAKPGREEALRGLLLGMIEPSRAEPGCRLYSLHEDRKAAGQFTFYECWADQAAFDAHVQTPHFRNLGQALGDILAEPLSLHFLRLLA